MSRKKLIGIVAVVAVLGVVSGVVGAGIASGADPGQAQTQYSAKFVCGFMPQVEGHQYPVKPGNYATVINIHNYTASAVRGDMQVALAYRPGMTPPPIIGSQKLALNKRRVGAVECSDIWAMVGVPPGTFLEGMLHIGLPFELPVAAVYTSQTNLQSELPADAGAGISIDVEYLVPFDITF